MCVARENSFVSCKSSQNVVHAEVGIEVSIGRMNVTENDTTARRIDLMRLYGKNSPACLEPVYFVLCDASSRESLILMRALSIHIVSSRFRQNVACASLWDLRRKYSHKSCGLWTLRAKWFRLIVRMEDSSRSSRAYYNLEANKKTQYKIRKNQNEFYDFITQKSLVTLYEKCLCIKASIVRIDCE